MKTFSRIYLFSKYGDWTGSQEGPEKKQCIIIIIKHWDSKSLQTGFISSDNVSVSLVRESHCPPVSPDYLMMISSDVVHNAGHIELTLEEGFQKCFFWLILLFNSCFLKWLAVTKLQKNFLFSKEEQQELQCM